MSKSKEQYQEAVAILRWLSKMRGNFDKAKRNLNEAQDHCQENCQHGLVVHANYVQYSWPGHASPPRRLCLACGAEEDSWYCGFKLMPQSRDTTVPPVIVIPSESRDDLYELRDPRLRLKILQMVSQGDQKEVPPKWVDYWGRTLNKSGAPIL